MAFQSFRDPVEYIVDQYFQRKRAMQNNGEASNTIEATTNNQSIEMGLPIEPMQILYNRDSKAYKFIYGNVESLMAGNDDTVIWQEELIRDENNVVTAFLKTYPDGSQSQTQIIKEEGRTTKFVVS